MNIELFGCAGGMAEGFRRAGIEFDLVVERDPDACASYRTNLGHEPECLDVHAFLDDIAVWNHPIGPVTLSPLPWRRYGAPMSWEVDLIVADPPCTPWSDAGKRKGLDDPRDCMLVTMDIIRTLRPRAYVIGNVPGLGNPSNLEIQREILAPLREAGYCTADFHRFDCADYGVPQHRKRPFWFGHLSGPCISWPAPTHAAPRKGGGGLLGIPAHRTCREALGHLPPDELGEPVTICWREGSDHRPSAPDEPAKTQTKNTHSDGALLMNPKHPPCVPSAPARTQTARAAGGHAGAQLLEWPWDRLATTVTTEDALGAPGHHKSGGQFGVGAIKLSEKARAILQGFPEDWVFVGKTKKSRAGQIGMAMPPPMAEAIARSVRDQMRKTCP